MPAGHVHRHPARSAAGSLAAERRARPRLLRQLRAHRLPRRSAERARDDSREVRQGCKRRRNRRRERSDACLPPTLPRVTWPPGWCDRRDAATTSGCRARRCSCSAQPMTAAAGARARVTLDFEGGTSARRSAASACRSRRAPIRRRTVVDSARRRVRRLSIAERRAVSPTIGGRIRAEYRGQSPRRWRPCGPDRGDREGARRRSASSRRW